MARRTYSREFKVSAVSLVQQQGYTVVQAAKNLGIDPGSLRGWLKQFQLDDGHDAAQSPAPSRLNCDACAKMSNA